MPKIIGLTGGIAMGKSTIAQKLACAGRSTGLGLWLNDSDAIVHSLMKPGGTAYHEICSAFGDICIAGLGSDIDRQKLGSLVFENKALRKTLEAILHPKIYRKTRQFVANAQRYRVPVIVLDIPLLFETGAQMRCDVIVSVSTNARVQKKRALKRPGMTPQKLSGILVAQAPNHRREKHSDFVINSSGGVALAYRQLISYLNRNFSARRFLAGRKRFNGKGQGWPPRYRRNGFWRR